MNKNTSEKIFAAILQGLSQIFVVEYIIGITTWFFLAQGLKDRSGTPLGADFLDVYAAGTLADNGRAALAYNWTVHGDIERSVAGYAAPYFGWHYPPLFLGVAGLLAFFPYLWALCLYTSVGFAAYFAALIKLLPRNKEYLWAAIAFPGVFVNIINGQNGFITTGLLALGLSFLESQPYVAGAVMGLLVYKPQFFFLIPCILLFAGYGRVFISCIASAILALGLSWCLYGSNSWSAFFESTKATRVIILEQGSTGWQKIQSTFSAARMFGASVNVSYGLQLSVGILATLCTVWIWWRTPNLALKGAALTLCLLLATPYIMDYDLVLLAIPLALLTRYGLEFSYKPYEKAFLFIAWLMPLLVRELGTYHLPLTPLLLLVLLILCFVKMRSHQIMVPNT